MMFHVLDDDELDFPFTGPTRFEGLEMPDVVRCNPRALREGYLQALEGFLDEVRRGCTRNNVDYALLADQPAAGRRPGRVPQLPVRDATQEQMICRECPPWRSARLERHGGRSLQAEN